MSRQGHKIVTVTIIHMSKKLSRDTKKTQIKLLEIKTTMYDITNTVDGINYTLENLKT